MGNRIEITTEELAKTLNIWLTIIGQRRPSLLRDLWTRKGEQHDARRIQHARHELARFLAEKFAVSGWSVTRKDTMHDKLWNGVEGIAPGGER